MFQDLGLNEGVESIQHLGFRSSFAKTSLNFLAALQFLSIVTSLHAKGYPKPQYRGHGSWYMAVQLKGGTPNKFFRPRLNCPGLGHRSLGSAILAIL